MMLKLEYKRLESGYHFCKHVDSHHLFCQWPVGAELTDAFISQSGALYSQAFIKDFIVQCALLAREQMK